MARIIFLLILVAGAVIGYLIGNPKGYGILGAVLGFIGWIIMAVIPAKESRSPVHRAPFLLTASRCATMLAP